MKFYKTAISITRAAMLLAAAIFTIQARPGDLDKTFGAGGVVNSPVPNVSEVFTSGAALQPDGKIVVVGSGNSSQGSVGFVARYNNDGSLDTSFGTNGATLVTFQQAGAVYVTNRLSAVAIQRDGKIIVGGFSETGDINIYYSDAVLARFNANGTLDTTFGSGGKILTQTGAGGGSGSATVYNLLIAPDGSIYAIGGSGNRSISNVEIFPAAILKITPNGASYTAVYPNYSPTDGRKLISAAVLQPDGKLVVGLRGGGYGGVAIITDFVLMRFNADLSVDTTFGTNGTVVTDFGIGVEQANGIVLDPNGKIVAAGGNASGNDTGDFYAARYNPNGTLDTTFGTGGKVVILYSDAPFPGNDKEGQSIVRQPDGKYISAFGARYGNLGAIRLLPNGALDAPFGSGGITYPTDPDYGSLILLQPNGKILLPGTAGGVKLVRLTNYARNDRADFEDDGKTDLSVVRSSGGALNWYELLSSNNQFAGVTFGSTGDKIAAADFDGDGKTDVAVFRPSNGVWYMLRSKLGFTGISFGQSGDVPVPADFDGDGKADVGVFRPSNGTWYYLRSSDNAVRAAQFGANGDSPVRSDFDRDGKADLAVFRPSNGTWYILNSSDNSFRATQFGANGDVPIGADFDGDAGADISVFRPSTGSWYYLRSTDNGFVGVQFGASGDIPLVGDFDADGRADEAIYRSGNWYILGSLNGFTGIGFGAASDTPVPLANLP